MGFRIDSSSRRACPLRIPARMPVNGASGKPGGAWPRMLIGLVLLAGCAGYQIGNQSLYPAHIRTVYVPMIESGSFRRNMGEWLTEAVMKEIELKTPYKVVGSPEAADSILTGRIVSEGKRVLVWNQYDDSREVEVDLQVEVSWIDRGGNVLRSGNPVPLPESIARVGATSSVISEVGRSVASAQQQAVKQVAEQIVAMMETPW